MSLTESQAARQQRMLEAASRLATAGGFDGVQMRAVAAEADVALGTLYRYFPSKEHLLVSAMLRQVGGLAERLAINPAGGDTPPERVSDVLRRATAALQRQPTFTAAVLRALVSGDPSVAPAVRAVREAMNAIILDALAGGDRGRADAGDDEVLVADLLEEIWLSALVGWIGGVYPAASVIRRLDAAVERLLD